MEQLLELLRQIQDLSGLAIEALEGASAETGEGGGEAPAEGGPPPAEAPAA
jgi:hypothetical protein